MPQSPPILSLIPWLAVFVSDTVDDVALSILPIRDLMPVSLMREPVFS